MPWWCSRKVGVRWLSKQFETVSESQSGVSLEDHESAMDDHDDPFQGMVGDGENDSAVGELGFNWARWFW